MSQLNSTLFINMMERYYRIDRNSALEINAFIVLNIYQLFITSFILKISLWPHPKRVSIEDSTRKRREKNALRKQRSKRSKAGPSTSQPDDDDSDHMEADDE